MIVYILILLLLPISCQCG